MPPRPSPGGATNTRDAAALARLVGDRTEHGTAVELRARSAEAIDLLWVTRRLQVDAPVLLIGFSPFHRARRYIRHRRGSLSPLSLRDAFASHHSRTRMRTSPDHALHPGYSEAKIPERFTKRP